MDLSISIVNWNTRELPDECLASVKADSPGLDVETIVVDNHSSDGSAEMVRRKHPDVLLIANDDNRGFAAANNQAFEKGAGQVHPHAQLRHRHPPRRAEDDGRVHGQLWRRGRGRLPTAQ